MQVHLLQRRIGQRLAFVLLPLAFAAQPFAPVHDLAPVVAARVGHRQQHLAVLGQGSQQLQQLQRHVAHAEHRHATRHRLHRRMARTQMRQHPLVQGGARGGALGVMQAGQHATPQFGLPALIGFQRQHTRRLEADIVARSPVLQPVGAINLVLVKQIGQAAGQLQQAVGLIALQKAAHRREHRLIHTARQEVHQPPGQRQLVQG